MTDDVSIVVGITGDTSGGRVIKKSLDDIATSGDKATTAADRLKAAVDKGNSGWKEASAYVVNYDAALKKGYITQEQYNQKIGQTGAALGKVNSLFSVGAGLIVAYFGAQTIGAIKDTAMQAEALRYRMDAAIGTFGDAGKAMEYVRSESERLGLNFKDTAGSFAAFAASGLRAGLSMKDVKDIFTGTSEAIRALKLSDEQAKSVFLALEQMAGKGVVQMQELKLQLGAALPGAIEIFAKAMGKTPAQFYAMVSAGEVTIDKLKVLGKAFHEEFGDAAVAASDSAISANARFKNSLFELGDEVGNSSGIMSAYKDTLGGLADFIKSDFVHGAIDVLRNAILGLRVAFDAVATGIGTAFALAINTIKQQINDALNLFNSLKNLSNNAFGTKFQQTDLLSTSSNLDILKDGAAGFNDNTVRLLAENNALANPIAKSYKPDSPGFDSGPSAAALKTQQKTARKEVSDALKAQKKQQDDITQAIKGSRTEQEKLNDEIANLERLKGFAKTKEQVDLLNRGIQNSQAELDKLRVKAELNSPTAKAFASLASEIDDGFKNSFKDAFTASDGGFKKLLDGWKNTFKSFLAELAYQALARPIVLSLVGGLGGAMGLSSNAVASVLGQVTGAPGIAGGGTGGGFSLTSLSSLSGLLNGGLYSKTLGGIGSGIGNLLSGQAYGAVGPSYGAAIGGSAFGNLGYGAIGGLAASLFGLGNKNALVNAGTSTAGSLIGGAFGGPIGALAGGFLGSALGGLFGGGKPTDGTQGGGVDLSTGAIIGINGMGGKKYNAQNASFRDSVLKEASELAKLFQSVGATTSGRTDVAIGSRDGLRLNTYDQYGVRNFGNNAQAFINAMMEAVLRGTTGLTGTFKTIVDKLGVSDTKKLANAFEFGKQFDAFLATANSSNSQVDALNQALDALNAQLATLQQQAIDLGLPTDKLTDAYNKQKDIILGSIKAQIAGFQSLQDMNAAFKSFFDGQALGNNSSLSPTEKLQLAQDNFGGLLSKAQGGDLSVTQDLLKSANELLDVGRNVYASSVSFAGLEGFVRSSVAGVASQAGYQGTDTTSSLTSEIIRANTQLNGSVSEMVEVLRDLYTEAVRTRKLQESVRNQNAAAA